MKQYTRMKRCSVKIIHVLAVACLLSQIGALQSPKRKCSQSPCPSPSPSPWLHPTESHTLHARPETKQRSASYQSRINDHRSPMLHPSKPHTLHTVRQTQQHKPSYHSGMHKPSPTPAISPTPMFNYGNKQGFFEGFFRSFEKLRKTLYERHTSGSVSKTTRLEPTPSRIPSNVQDDFRQRVKRLTDEIMSFVFKDLLGNATRHSASLHIQPTVQPHPSASPTTDQREETRKSFFSLILEGSKEDKMFMDKFLPSPNIRIEDDHAMRNYARNNVSRIAVGYWKLISWMLKQMQSSSCRKDCGYIERMVQFCKDQHTACPNAGPMPSSFSPSRKPSVRPSPSPSIPSRPLCSAGAKNCPFRTGCLPYNARCMNDFDVFKSRIMPMPTPSSRSVLNMATRMPPGPSPKSRTYNQTLLEYAWREAAKQNSQLKLDDLKKTFNAFYTSLRPDNANGQSAGESREICSRMCQKKNTTFCWSEMKCKQEGAKCSLRHLAKMMNQTAFEEQEKCNLSFYCPVRQNCTSNNASCNADKFMELPCDAKCMNATGGRGKKPGAEEIEIFRLKCRSDDKYCPSQAGCVGKTESCVGNKKLRVPLGSGPEDERRAFCRLRDYICPSVYSSWKRMRCSNEELSEPGVKEPEKPYSRSVSPQTRTRPPIIEPKPTPSKTWSRHASHSSTVQPAVPHFSLPSVTLRKSNFLSSLINLSGGQRYIAIAKLSCASSLEFEIPSNGRNLQKITLPDASSNKGLLLSLNTFLHYTSTQPSFHGLCLLNYSPYTLARGERYSPKVVSIAPNGQSGSIAIIISPSAVQVRTRLIGKNIISIKEDATNIPCFKLKDMIQFNVTGAKLASNIRPEYEGLIELETLSQYKSKLASLSTGRIQAAIIGAQGLSMRSGNWKQRNAMSRFENFPKFLSKERPLIIPTDRCIAFFPAKDFNGKLRLLVIGALTIVNNGRTENIFGGNVLQVGVDVLSEPDAPELAAKDSCLPAYPFNFDQASNTGFKVEDILRAGYIRCGSRSGKKSPLINNIGAYIGKRIGLAITASAGCRLGHWEYKKNGTFERVSIGGGLGFCLLKADRFRFVPNNYTTLWDIQQAQACLYVKVKAWLPLSANATGLCNVTDTKGSMFSKADVQLSAVRQGCDGIDGSMRKPDACGMCGKTRIGNIQCPCDKVPGSGAVIDECGDCTGGTTGRLYKTKDCAQKCYANGTQSENLYDSCGRCQMRTLAARDARDCNGDCSFGKRRACRNKCGICVGGRTNKPLNDGINACGACIANSSAVCAMSLELSKAIEVGINQMIVLKIKARGYTSLRSLSCLLQTTGAAPRQITLRTGYARRKSMPVSIYPDMCEEDESGDYEVEIAAAIANGGDYRLSCKVNQESSYTAVNRGDVKVISQHSTVQSIVPPTIDSCRNGTFILKGSGFKNSSDVACGASCEKRCDFKAKGTYINETAFACEIEVEGNKEDCEAQDVNLHAMISSAARPPPFSQSSAKVVVQCVSPKVVSVTFSKSFRLLTIHLDKPASLVRLRGRRVTCESFFSSETIMALGQAVCVLVHKRIYVSIRFGTAFISRAVGSVATLNVTRENLKCFGKEKFSVIHGGRVQKVDISVPSDNVVAVMSGGTSVGTCGDLRLDGAASTGGMGGKLKYVWELYKNSTVVQSEGRRSWFKIRGTGLTPNGNYKVKLCVTNEKTGQSKCKESPLTVFDNSNSTLTVKVNGARQRTVKARGRYKFAISARINQCGRNARRASKMLFTWLVKDKDGVVIRTSEGRSLDVQKGSLAPGKNYTLHCYVRAHLESGEDVTGETDIAVQVEGSPVKAKIRGGRELTVGCGQRVTLDGGQSNDPDSTDESPRYSWSCSETDGSPCFNKSNLLQRLSFKEASVLKFGDILECNKSYVFNLEYTKGDRKSNTSVTVTLKPGEPAETRLELQKVNNRIILRGYIKTASSANVSWKCINQLGYGFVDLSDPTIARDILPGPISARGNSRKVVRTKVLVLYSDYLGQGSKYLIGLDVVNGDGVSSAQIVVEIPSAPTPGEIIIDPPDGLALNTSFTISAGNGWSSDVSSFDIGYEMQTKKGAKEIALKARSSQSFIDGTQLPPGAKENNYTLKAFIIARNSDGLQAKATIDIKVRDPEQISEEGLNDKLSQITQALNELDIEKAIGSILALSETMKGKQVTKEDLTDQLTTQAINILPQVQDTRECLAALMSTTAKREIGQENGTASDDLQGSTKETVTRSLFESNSGQPATSVAAESKRKRRSVVNSGTQDTFTAKSKEEVDSTMAIFDNVIDEEEPGNLQDNMKMNFTSTIPFLLRSLCASTATVNDYLISTSNLSTIRSNRLSGHTFDTNNVNISGHVNGSLLLLGAYFKEKYEAWNCSASEQLCTEVCIGSVLYHHHMFVGESEGRISDIVSTMFIHPDTHSVENVGTMTSSLTYQLSLKEVPDPQHTVECRVWDTVRSNWTTDGCNTSYSGGGNTSCHCSVLGNVTVFKVALPIATTLFPPIATTDYSSTTQQSTHGNVSSSSPSTTKGASSTTLAPKPSVEVSFSFPVNYNNFVSKAAELKTAITDMLASKLNISKSRIVNLEIRSGSIIVTFTLLGNDGHSGEMNVNDLQTMLTSLASNGSLSLTFDGVTMTADAASLTFTAPTTTVHVPTTEMPPPKKSKSSNTVVIVVSVCVAIVIILAIVAAVWYVKVKKKRSKNIEKNTPFGSATQFGDDIRLQDRSRSSLEHFEATNKGYADSPELVKKPLRESNELDAPSTRTITPVETKSDPPATFANDYGGVVAVGIGSASSLKRDVFDH